MHQVQNFFLTARVNTSSKLEKCADILLTPARFLCGGKRVVVFHDHSTKETMPINFSPPIKTILKVVAFIALPLAAVGTFFKLLCLKDQNFRAFCAQKNLPDCHPKLYEMYQHIYSTAKFTSGGSSQLNFKPLDLYECACVNTQEFHRLLSPRRNNLENAIVQRLIDSRPDKTQPIDLISMGSGGLMSDFLVLEKLILAGFKKITLDCVDSKGIDSNQLENIREFFAEYEDVSIEINGYDNINKVPEEKNKYAAVLAIDYDTLTSFNSSFKFDATADLMKAQKRLSPTGFLGLGFSYEDTLSGPKLATQVITSKGSLIQSLAADFAKRLPEKEELVLRIPSFDFADVAHLFLFSLALAIEKRGTPYRKISLLCDASRKNDKFQDMMNALFANTTIEVTLSTQLNKKCDLLLTGSLENKFTSKSYLSCLNAQATTYIFFPGGKISRQNDQQEHQRVRIL